MTKLKEEFFEEFEQENGFSLEITVLSDVYETKADADDNPNSTKECFMSCQGYEK